MNVIEIENYPVKRIGWFVKRIVHYGIYALMGHFGTIRIFHRTETPDWEILQLFSIIRRFRQLVTMTMTKEELTAEINTQVGSRLTEIVNSEEFKTAVVGINKTEVGGALPKSLTKVPESGRIENRILAPSGLTVFHVSPPQRKKLNGRHPTRG